MPCLACGNEQYNEIFSGIRSCKACRFAWADVNLSSAQWRELYNTRYFFGDEYVDYLGEERALRKNFKRNLQFMAGYRSSGKLLEIGSAYGFFLDEASRYYSVTGVDIHQEGCQYALDKFGADTRTGDLLAMPFENGSFDVITMWDTLEHLPNPQDFIKKAQSLLKDKGYLFFSTLDITSVLSRVQGRGWRQIHPPTHVSYFSRESLKIMLERFGFTVLAIKRFGDHRTWDNTWFNLLVLRWGKKELYHSLKQKGWLKGEYYLNTFDHVYFAARKN
jgi:2-polyprenyl-3-methyl-5-hydroxy-6-metoxy-1,4-benzoquinol methylase